MALSQDEQRVLAEIERRLTADDPGLATCLTAFRRPGPATVLRSPRARIIGSLFTVLLVAMVSLMVYAMIPFRTHAPRPAATQSAGSQSGVTISSAAGSEKAHVTQSAPASSRSVTTNTSAAPAAGVSASSGRAAQPKDQAAGHTTPAAAGPLSPWRAVS